MKLVLKKMYILQSDIKITDIFFIFSFIWNIIYYLNGINYYISK